MEVFLKLADEEIIKTLECCSGEHCVNHCPLRKVDDCMGILCRNALDLINRLKTEVSISTNFIPTTDCKDYPPYLDRPKKGGE